MLVVALLGLSREHQVDRGEALQEPEARPLCGEGVKVELAAPPLQSSGLDPKLLGEVLQGFGGPLAPRAAQSGEEPVLVGRKLPLLLAYAFGHVRLPLRRLGRVIGPLGPTAGGGPWS